MNVTTDVSASVISIEVGVGDGIAAGDTVAILESMKMEIPIEAEAAGVVASIEVGPGDIVSEGDILVVLR